ncbi:prepilin-type N-terminal cleavage/methylation domain-containing protein [Marinospirillum sp.]|uniref:prepilin-type N-terminal cleavage/methylation domain-containing protein n=1 Tax=Marinospirillum sp. TaxID=2183934 RepID=UPI003A87305E
MKTTTTAKSLFEPVQQQQGINLLEVLLVLAVMAVLLGWAMPQSSALRERQLQRIELNRLQLVLQGLRQQASLMQQSLRICASDDGLHCTSLAVSGGLLVLDAQDQPVSFTAGMGVPLALVSPLLVRPLPQRGVGGSLLPCTGFRYQAPQGLTLSVVGRVRREPTPAAALVALCLAA